MDEAIENKEIFTPELDKASAYLSAQLAGCNEAIERCFKLSHGVGGSIEWQLKALQTATRLIQASAVAAATLKRMKGTESRHTVRVEQQGGDPIPKKAKTNSGRRA